MNKLYGTFIFFFYFFKYPIIGYLVVTYFILDFPHNYIMDILGFVSINLIIKDIFFPHEP